MTICVTLGAGAARRRQDPAFRAHRHPDHGAWPIRRSCRSCQPSGVACELPASATAEASTRLSSKERRSSRPRRRPPAGLLTDLARRGSRRRLVSHALNGHGGTLSTSPMARSHRQRLRCRGRRPGAACPEGHRHRPAHGLDLRAGVGTDPGQLLALAADLRGGRASRRVEDPRLEIALKIPRVGRRRVFHPIRCSWSPGLHEVRRLGRSSSSRLLSPNSVTATGKSTGRARRCRALDGCGWRSATASAARQRCRSIHDRQAETPGGGDLAVGRIAAAVLADQGLDRVWRRSSAYLARLVEGAARRGPARAAPAVFRRRIDQRAPGTSARRAGEGADALPAGREEDAPPRPVSTSAAAAASAARSSGRRDLDLPPGRAASAAGAARRPPRRPPRHWFSRSARRRDGWRRPAGRCLPPTRRSQPGLARRRSRRTRSGRGPAGGLRVRPASEVMTSSPGRLAQARQGQGLGGAAEDQEALWAQSSARPTSPPWRSKTRTSTSVSPAGKPPSAVARARSATASASGSPAWRGRSPGRGSPCWPAPRISGGPGRRPGSAAMSARKSRSTWLRPECRSRWPGGQLGELAEAAAQGEAGQGMPAQVLEQAAGEVAHVQHGVVGQAVERLDRLLRGRAGAAGDVGEARGPGDVDAAVDRVDPGRAGEGHHHARGAQDRQAALDAEARVPGLRRQRGAARDRDLDLQVAGRRRARRFGHHGRAHHLARRRVDRRLADRQRQARLWSRCRRPRRRGRPARCRPSPGAGVATTSRRG